MIINENWITNWQQNDNFDDIEILVAYDEDTKYILFSKFNYGDYSIRMVKEDRISGERVPVSNLIMVQNIGDNVVDLVKSRGEQLVESWLKEHA